MLPKLKGRWQPQDRVAQLGKPLSDICFRIPPVDEKGSDVRPEPIRALHIHGKEAWLG